MSNLGIADIAVGDSDIADSSQRALLIVDVQRDFVTGSLKVPEALELIPLINNLMLDYNLIAASMDWHIDPKDHFSDEPDYSNSWPQHCVAGSDGADLLINVNMLKQIFRKGHMAASYSAFDGHNDSFLGLEQWLHSKAINHIDVVGIATDYCVAATCLDAIRHGFSVNLLINYCRAVNAEASQKVLDSLINAGVQIDDRFIA